MARVMTCMRVHHVLNERALLSKPPRRTVGLFPWGLCCERTNQRIAATAWLHVRALLGAPIPFQNIPRNAARCGPSLCVSRNEGGVPHHFPQMAVGIAE